MALTDCCFGKAFQRSPEKKKKKKVGGQEKRTDEVTGNGNTVAECTKKKTKSLKARGCHAGKKSCAWEIGCCNDLVGVLNEAELNLTDLREISNWSVSRSNWNEWKLMREMSGSMKRPIKCKIRIATCSAERDEARSRKTSRSRMIIASDVLWSLVICDADDRTREWVLIRHAFWAPNLL